ncbi:MAG TPA: hypothetical protein VN224_00735 [Xanthomonadales bacterium]|nr:hypothetical protein [Xanthomonadales bacterium]
MRHKIEGGRGGFSPFLKEFGRRIEEADGIVPLQPGEHRPLGYYLSGYWSIGRKPIDMSKPAPPPKPRDKR